MLKKFFLVIGLLCVVTISIAAPPQVIFQLEKNIADRNFAATMTVINNNSTPIQNWELAFTSTRSLTEVQGGKITQQAGGFYVISPNDAAAIPANGKFIFHLVGKWTIRKDTDAPNGYFLVLTNPETATETTQAIAAQTILPAWTPAKREDPYSRNKINNQTAIENNAVNPALTLDQSLIIPLPAYLKRSPGKFVLQGNTTIVVDENAVSAMDAAKFFADAISAPTNFHFSPVTKKITQIPANVILLTEKGADAKLGQEGYILEVTPKNIIIRATASAGFFYALQSLRQLLPPAIFDSKSISHIAWAVPDVTIQDYPRFSYRGLHLDSARHFISVTQVKRLIDLMALHKLNKFQWHLTDDEGWRVEIKKYPTLTSIGAWRGYNQVNPPALGSGAESYGGYYSQNEIRDVVQYATARHITIIPEIDMPGHARAMIMSLHSSLIDREERSHYTSVQGFHDNVLSPCMETTFQVIDNVMTEIADLFPGDTIHIGSDEVPSGTWDGSAHCQALVKSLGLNNTNQLQHYFLTRVQNIIQSKNKKMAGWEEIVKDGDLDKSAVVYSWTNENAGLDAAKRGYDVVMMPANYLYFDLAYNANPKEPGGSWAGYVDTFKAYSYQPIHSDWPENVSKRILGIQGALWSERITTPQRLDYFAFPRVLALSEVAWTPKDRRNWINFSERVSELHLKRLDHYGVQYRRTQQLE